VAKKGKQGYLALLNYQNYVAIAHLPKKLQPLNGRKRKSAGAKDESNSGSSHGAFSSSCEDGRTALLERVLAYHTLTDHCRYLQLS
jgi:hypothetical protein